MYHKFNDTCIFNLKNVNYWVTPEYNDNTLKQKYILMWPTPSCYLYNIDIRIQTIRLSYITL